MSTARQRHDRHHFQVVASAISFIRNHAQQQPSLADIAAEVGLSEYHLQRVFAAWAGISPKRFLQFLTKEHAIRALRESRDVLSVALETGLSGPGRLHELMVTCEAMTPGEIKTRGLGVEVGYGVGDSPFGEVLLGWTDRGVCYLAFCDGDRAAREQELWSQWSAATRIADPEAAAHLSQRIFAREPRPGGLHLLLCGTNFQLKVWEALLSTHRSQRISYSQLAAAAGVPRGQRAVGSAVAANNLGYLIPCHRVIRESGESGNYRWGRDRKAAIQIWESGLG